METLPTFISGFLAVLLFSAFVKIFTTLSILKLGLGLKGGSFGIVLAGLALALSIFVTDAQLSGVGGYSALFSGSAKPAEIERSYRPFLERQTKPEVLKRFETLSNKLAAKPAASDKSKDEQQANPDGVSSAVLVASFLISQLQDALKLGLMFIIPFLVIDLLVANALMAVGVGQVSMQTVALPLKLLLFLAVDGWALVSEKLLAGYLQ